MTKAEEKLNEFIEKNLKKEHDKFMCGSKNILTQWEDLRDTIKSMNATNEYIEEQRDLIKLHKEFMKSKGYTDRDFKEWLNARN